MRGCARCSRRALGVAGEPRVASFQAGHVAGIAATAARPARGRPGPVAVSLRDVTFRYPGAERPRSRSWPRHSAGALVAVTGPVGSGKSALARALLGIYPSSRAPCSSMAVRSTTLTPRANGADSIGYLPQDPLLFSGSVRENVALGPRRCADATIRSC